MKVLLIDQFGELGGAQRCLVEVAAGLLARGAKVFAALPRGPAFDRLAALVPSMRPLAVGPFRSARKSPADALRLAAQIPAQAAAISRMSRAVDVVYLNGPRLAPAVALSKGTRPAVFHAHSIVPQRTAAALLSRSLRRFDRTIAVSHFVARWLDSIGYPRSQVIYSGVPSPVLPPRKPSVHFRIGILGRIAPEKGQLEFVRAAKLAVNRDPRLRFVVAGGALFDSESYSQTVRVEAGPEVEFPGWNEDIAAFFAQIDLLVVPSSPLDAAPRVVLEAFAARVPVLAARAGGIPELIEHGRTGLLFDSNAPQLLAQAMLATSRRSDLDTLASTGHSAWNERFTLERFQSEVCGALEEVLRSRRSPASAGSSARA